MIEKNTIKIDEGERRTGKDEMNLVELPFTLLAIRNTKNLKTIERQWKGKGADGQEKEFYKIITSSDKWGLPTFVGEEVYLACMELSHKQGFENRKVSATQYEILKLMGWPTNEGKSYKRLIKAFNQLLGVVITTNAFWDNQEKKYRKLGFGIIDDYMFFEEERRGRRGQYNQPALPLGYFRWNETLFEQSFKKGNIKTLDTALYFTLKSHISKRLYRYADKKLYNQKPFELDLFRLAFEKLEMTGNYKYPSEIIRKLNPALTELKDRGIANIQIKESQTESKYKVCFRPVSKNKAQVAIETEPPKPPKATSPKKQSTPHQLVNHFLEQRNLQAREPNQKELHQAEALINEHGEGKAKYITDYALKSGQATNFEMKFFGAILNYQEEALVRFKQQYEYSSQNQFHGFTDQEDTNREEYKIYQIQQAEKYISSLEPIKAEQLKKDADENFYNKHPAFRKKENEEKSKMFVDLLEQNFKDQLIEQGTVKALDYKKWLTEKAKKNPASAGKGSV